MHNSWGGGNYSMSRSVKVLNAIQRLGILGGKKARNTRKYGKNSAKILSSLRKDIRHAQSSLSYQKGLKASTWQHSAGQAQSKLANARATYKTYRSIIRSKKTGHSFV